MSVPPLIVVAPVYVLAPVNVSVPVPTLMTARELAPLLMTPLKVALASLSPRVSVAGAGRSVGDEATRGIRAGGREAVDRFGQTVQIEDGVGGGIAIIDDHVAVFLAIRNDVGRSDSQGAMGNDGVAVPMVSNV